MDPAQPLQTGCLKFHRGKIEAAVYREDVGLLPEMNCQHVCEYIFPEAMVNAPCCPSTQRLYASVWSSTLLFNTVNMHTRASSGNTKSTLTEKSQNTTLKTAPYSWKTLKQYLVLSFFHLLTIGAGLFW